MTRVFKVLALVLVVLIVGAVLAIAYARLTGLSARAVPGPFERFLAASVRSWAVPSEVRDRANPVPRTDENVRKGLEHFADHCATCHANDGSGNTTIGKSLFPPAPDMRLAGTQDLTDGELFHIIEEGVRFTGMPAWSSGTPEGEVLGWQLVHFIRRLPQLTRDEIEQMEGMNPRPPEQIRQEIEAERFLQGTDAQP
jgi:mono/diheme cytochrome c family protein